MTRTILTTTIAFLVVSSTLNVIDADWSFRGAYEDAIKAMSDLSQVLEHNKTDGSVTLQNLQFEVQNEKDEEVKNVTVYIPTRIQALLDRIQGLEDQAANQGIDVSECTATKSELVKTTDIILGKISKCSKPITKKIHDLIGTSITDVYNFGSYLTTLQEAFLTCTNNKCFEDIETKAQEYVVEIPGMVMDIITDVQIECIRAIGDIGTCCGQSIDEGMNQAQSNANAIIICIQDSLK